MFAERPLDINVRTKDKQSRWRRLINITWMSAPPLFRVLLLLWVFVPVAIVLGFTKPNEHRMVFAFSYIAIVPCASTLDLVGQEIARMLPRVAGIAVETLLSTVVEVVLFIILIAQPPESGNTVTIIKAAILGSVLANMLLCLGICLFVGGIKYKEQKFHSLVGGTSADILLGSGFVLLLPAMLFSALYSSAASSVSNYSLEQLSQDVLYFSRGTAIILLTTFFVYTYHNVKSRRTLLDQVLRKEEENESVDRLTPAECLITAATSLGCVCVVAYTLVRQIHPIVLSGGISENFMGLILVPLVEKMAEHVTAVNKVLKNQPNMAIFHCMSPSISTALFNTPVVVFVGWGLQRPMDLNFEVFQVVSLLLAILVVINFLGDGTSNYLKGYVLIIIYITLAVGAWYYPSITINSQNEGHG